MRLRRKAARRSCFDESLPVIRALFSFNGRIGKFWLTAIASMHDVAPVTSGGSDEVETPKKEQLTMQWASLWRTIVLSSLGKTLFPYSKYVRRLDLQDLQELLQDNKFRDSISR